MEELTLYRRTRKTFKHDKDEFRQAIGWLFQNNREEIAEELDKYFQFALGLKKKEYTDHEEFKEGQERHSEWKKAFGPVLSAVEISIKNRHSPEELIDEKWLEYKQQSPYHEVG